jgi:hypothetical protein
MYKGSMVGSKPLYAADLGLSIHENSSWMNSFHL